MPRKKKSSSSLLKNQKPKTRHKTNNKRFGLLTSLILLVTASCFAVGYYGLPYLKHIWHLTNPTIIQLVVNQKSSNRFPIIAKNLSQQKYTSSEEAIAQIKQAQRLMAAKRYHFFKNPNLTWLVNFEFHQPVAVIRYGIDRLVSAKGLVFGQFNKDSHHHLPVVKGFNIKSKLRLLDDQSIELSEVDQAKISEVLLLIQLGMGYNISYRSITFDSVRGFQLRLREKNILVEIGQSPFAKKYRNLIKILDNLAQKSVNSARIEVDYNGKAFIKEYKL